LDVRVRAIWKTQRNRSARCDTTDLARKCSPATGYDGNVEIVESWEDNVPSGKYTDFRRAVDAKDGEKIVFTWQVWPDKATLDSAEAKMHEDKRLEVSGEIPFNPRRLILGSECSCGRDKPGSGPAKRANAYPVVGRLNELAILVPNSLASSAAAFS
jgi:uncharacterized protein YbaA (DUF1428 family)